MKKFILIVLACVVVVGGVVLLKKDKTSAPASPTNHTYGSGSSGVKLVEFGDFQCPGCYGFFPIVKQIKEKYKDEVTFQFVNFPLAQLHQNTLAAHRAAQAASNQGKFWEMHDLLYANQKTWESVSTAPTVFEGYATQLGLDMTRYRTDFASAETNAVINADITLGQSKRVTGTPTFFLDGKQIEQNTSVASVDLFSKAIDDAILAKTGQPSKASAQPSVTSTITQEQSAPAQQ